MNRRNLVTISVAALSLLVPSAIYAAPVSALNPVHAMFGKEKSVKLDIRNDSQSSIELKVGEKVVTVDAGKSVTLNLPVGTRILANTATPTHEVGSLIAQVSSNLAGATVAVK